MQSLCFYSVPLFFRGARVEWGVNMPRQLEKLTTQEAMKTYFGSIKKLSKSPLPWKCRCGVGVFHLKDMIPHIRKNHHRVITRVAQ